MDAGNSSRRCPASHSKIASFEMPAEARHSRFTPAFFSFPAISGSPVPGPIHSTGTPVKLTAKIRPVVTAVSGDPPSASAAAHRSGTRETA